MRKRVEHLRLAAAKLMNLGDSRARRSRRSAWCRRLHGGTISTRTFIPHVCMRQLAYSRAQRRLGVRAAGSVTESSCDCRRIGSRELVVEHPTASHCEMEVDLEASPVRFARSALLRTARKLMEGKASCRNHFGMARNERNGPDCKLMIELACAKLVNSICDLQ